ncbi:hypothetical protein B0H10DRAFT_2081532 [Mycena sp. CBHHK59/15]|nr:hypothetical protein B0H10DRAFT_2081532 [Mycena sp. CBHHK59/15]
MIIDKAISRVEVLTAKTLSSSGRFIENYLQPWTESLTQSFESHPFVTTVMASIAILSFIPVVTVLTLSVLLVFLAWIVMLITVVLLALTLTITMAAALVVSLTLSPAAYGVLILT